MGNSVEGEAINVAETKQNRDHPQNIRYSNPNGALCIINYAENEYTISLSNDKYAIFSGGSAVFVVVFISIPLSCFPN